AVFSELRRHLLLLPKVPCFAGASLIAQTSASAFHPGTQQFACKPKRLPPGCTIRWRPRWSYGLTAELRTAWSCPTRRDSDAILCLRDMVLVLAVWSLRYRVEQNPL